MDRNEKLRKRPRRPRRTLITDRTILAFLLLVLTVPSAAAQVRRITIDQPASVPSTATFKGTVELMVMPPFEPARVTISVDQQVVAVLNRAPYLAPVDLGPSVIEHEVRVTMMDTGGSGTTATWKRQLNPGHQPLAIHLERDSGAETIQARVTAPLDDPVTEVEFLQGTKVLTRLTAPPWTIPSSEVDPTLPLFATVRSAHGEEEMDHLSFGGSIHVESVEVRTVPLFVSVSDPRGRPRTDLDRGNFSIVDKGVPGKIVEFGKAFNEPISLVMLLDASTSMTPYIEHVSGAASDFVTSVLKPGDHFSLFSIRTAPHREIHLSDDVNLIRRSFENLSAAGSTSLWDALRFGVRELDQSTERRAIVLFSDGRDTDSVTRFEDVSRLVRLSGIPMYVIAFGVGEDNKEGTDRLRYLATQTGGFMVQASDSDLERAFHRIEEDLRAQYAIRYQVTDNVKPNQWREVAVSVDVPRLEARTIRGYFAQ